MMKDSVVAKTRIEDLDEAMRIYDFARVRMTEGGNPNQWTDGYPSRDVIAEDIESGNSYKIVIDGRITGLFTFIIGDDPTYKIIEGEWLNNKPYGTIHRIAAAPGAKGIADICLDYCRSRIADIRIDTHRDNAPMLGWIRSRRFRYCGIIHCHNGSPRLAFQTSGGRLTLPQ